MEAELKPDCKGRTRTSSDLTYTYLFFFFFWTYTYLDDTGQDTEKEHNQRPLGGVDG